VIKYLIRTVNCAKNYRSLKILSPAKLEGRNGISSLRESLAELIVQKTFYQSEGNDSMIRSLVPLKISYKSNINDKYMPKNMKIGKVYPVVAEQVKKRIDKESKKEVEDLHFGFIGDDYSLSFVASYNCYISDDTGAELEKYAEEKKPGF
jgi:hypothetical protein